MNKNSLFLRNSIWFVFSFLFGWIYIDVLMIDKSINYNRLRQVVLSNISIIVILLIVCLAVGIFLYKFRNIIIPWSSNNFKKVLIIGSLVLFILQIFIIYETYFFTDWDAGILVRYSNSIAHGNTEDFKNFVAYYSSYPNNIMLTFLFSLIIKVCYFFGYTNAYLSLLIIGAALVNISGLILALLAKKS